MRIDLYHDFKTLFMKNKLLAVIFGAVALGCSSSEKIISSWKAENVQPKQFNKILVLAIIKEPDQRIRQKMEEHFVGDLRDIGYSATTSMSAFGSNPFTLMNEDSVVNYIKNSGADAVITIVLLDKSQEQPYIGSRLRYGPVPYPFGTYYSAMNERVSDTGYFVTDSKYFWETNFYDIATRQLLYSVQIQSFLPSTSEIIDPHQYGKLIVIDMVNKKVL